MFLNFDSICTMTSDLILQKNYATIVNEKEFDIT